VNDFVFRFLSSFAVVIASPAVSAENQTKNVVLILADDLGWADTTLYGKTSLYETPNIERLAARGMTFSNAYASPICSPTRASIMTRQNPARHGMTAPVAHLANEQFEATVGERGLPDPSPTPRLSLALIVIFRIGGGRDRNRATLRRGDIQTRNSKKVSRVSTSKIAWRQRRLPGSSRETVQNLSS